MTFDFYSGSSTEHYFSAYGLTGATSFINTGSLLSIDAGINSYLESADASSEYKMNIEIFAFSGGNMQNITYVAFKTNKNSANQGTLIFKNTVS
jgi:hypothetical protein